MNAQMKVDRCITRLLRMYPFWGSLILGFEIQPSTVIQTMVTDGVRLFFNPDYVEQQNETILVTDLAHEGGHKMFLDSFRRGLRDPKRWNIACDYRINLYLQDSGLKLGDDYLIDDRFRGMDAEKIYNILSQDPDDPANKQAEEKGGCGCGGLHDHPSQPNQDQKDQKPETGLTGLQDDYNENGSQPSSAALSGADFDEAEALMQIAQAMNFAKAQGKLPGSLDELVEEILNPKIRWEQVLERFMENCNQDDFTWLVPDRRFLNQDIYLPGLESEGVDEFVVVLDTSGSTLRYIPQFLGEVSKIASVLKFRKLHIMYVDVKVQHVDEYGKEDLPIKPGRTYGGGSTSFLPTFSWLEERCITPKGMIYLTDTYGSFPKVPPPFPVLWTIPAECRAREIPFGEMVMIN
jgi:predicted metal-dependent peptidase